MMNLTVPMALEGGRSRSNSSCPCLDVVVEWLRKAMIVLARCPHSPACVPVQTWEKSQTCLTTKSAWAQRRIVDRCEEALVCSWLPEKSLALDVAVVASVGVVGQEHVRSMAERPHLRCRKASGRWLRSLSFRLSYGHCHSEPDSPLHSHRRQPLKAQWAYRFLLLDVSP